MHAVSAWASAEFADIAHMAISFGSFVLSIWLGIKVAGWTNRNWLGWIVGPIVLASLFYVSIPTMTALTAIKCRGSSDYNLCIDGGEVYDSDWS